MEFRLKKSTKLLSGKVIFAILFGIVIIISLWKNSSEDNSISQHRKVTIGKINRIKGYKNTHRIVFRYYVDGKTHKGFAPLRDGYPRRVRMSTPEIGEYYAVEYDSLDHTNHRIIIGEAPLKPFSELKFTETVVGCVLKQKKLDKYVDVFIDYSTKGYFHSFRTRLHKDSLNFQPSEKCTSGLQVNLEVSKNYTFINDLFFKSRDRQYKGAYSTQGKWNQ